MNTQPNQPPGLWISRDLWQARGLSLREKVLLAKLRAAGAAHGCRASNRELGELLGVGERHVRTCLAALRELGLIAIRHLPAGGRIIRATGRSTRVAAPRSRPGRPRKGTGR